MENNNNKKIFIKPRKGSNVKFEWVNFKIDNNEDITTCILFKKLEIDDDVLFHKIGESNKIHLFSQDEIQDFTGSTETDAPCPICREQLVQNDWSKAKFAGFV